MASNSQYTLPPQSSPQESASSKSQLHSKQSSNGPSPENFVTIGGSVFRTLRIWLKKEDELNSDFWPFEVCHFKIVTITTPDWGKLYKLLNVLLDMSICSRRWYHENAWLKPPFWNQAITTYGLHYCKPIIMSENRSYSSQPYNYNTCIHFSVYVLWSTFKVMY